MVFVVLTVSLISLIYAIVLDYRLARSIRVIGRALVSITQEQLTIVEQTMPKDDPGAKTIRERIESLRNEMKKLEVVVRED